MMVSEALTSPRAQQLNPAERTLQVLVADLDSHNIFLISKCLAEVKECVLSACADPGSLLKRVSDLNPDLIILSGTFLGEKTTSVLNLLRHQNHLLYVIVTLPAGMEAMRDTLTLAGATECVFTNAAGFQDLSSVVKRALIRISEQDCMANPSGALSDELVPDIVFTLDMEGCFVYVSSSITNTLGFMREEILNVEFLSLVTVPEQQVRFQNYLANSSEQIAFESILTLQTSLGIEEDYQVRITLMEGEVISGIAKKVAPLITPAEWEQALKLDDDSTGSAHALDNILAAEEPEPEKMRPIPEDLGPYQVLELLGQGAMGEVYKGFDVQLERPVAIKIINGSLQCDPETLERFRREARILASISHPNIALIYYFDVCDGLPFFCMEFMPEGSIEDLLKKKKTLDPDTAISFIQQVAQGLNKAQEKGVVHLDIKPSNLMIAEKNRVKIVDFGLAATRRDLQETKDKIIGTPAYVAPEQLNNSVIDHRSDIYSLGITFFEMLFGFVPFLGKSLREIFTNKLTQNLPALELLDCSVPGPLYELIGRMVDRDPEKRIRKYSDIVEQLEQIRRDLSSAAVSVETPSEPASTVHGNLYDSSLAEVLGEVWKNQYTGRLTLKWLDLSKVIHFQAGTITAVLSNQEGERFIDLLLAEKHLKPETAWKIQTARSDLFTKYSFAMEQVQPANREDVLLAFESMASKILESLFSWVTGDYYFEFGDFPAQPGIQIQPQEFILRCARKNFDSGVVRRKLNHGRLKIGLVPNYATILRQVKLSASERYLLTKAEAGLTFDELHKISNLPVELCFRLVYMLYCLGLIQIEKLTISRETQLPQIEALRVEPQTSVEAPPAKPQKDESPQKPKVQTPVLASDALRQLAHEAVEDYKKGDYYATVRKCKTYLEHRKEYRIYHLMGKALATHEGFKHEAMSAFKEALELTRAKIPIEKDIADLYFRATAYCSVLFHYKKILEKSPEDQHCMDRVKEIKLRKIFGRFAGLFIPKKETPRKKSA